MRRFGTTFNVPTNTRALRGRTGHGRHNNNADPSKPHAHIGERTRHLWQIQHKQLTGGHRNRFGNWVPFVHDDAEYASHGLVSPRAVFGI